MSCLLCLRNEGIQFPNESPNDLEILLNLFKLPKDLSQRLQGNLCCSLCRVKLQFVEVINQEILILGQKLKCLEEEVKEIFVSSFNGNDESNQRHGNSTQARMELKIFVGIKETQQVGDEANYGEFEDEGDEMPFETQTVNSESLWQQKCNYENDNSEILMSQQLKVEVKDFPVDENDVFNEENEIFISSENQVYIVGDDEDLNEQNSFQDSNFECSRSFDSAQTSSSSTSFSAKIKQDKMKKRKKIKRKVKVNQRRKFRISVCTICKNAEGIRLEFDRSEDYEEHLKIIHPSRPYSKCSNCSRVITEDSVGSEKRLAEHVKQVHMARVFKCQQCGAKFKTFKTMRIHSEIHLNREIFICEHCDSRITGERNFKVHMKRKHPDLFS